MKLGYSLVFEKLGGNMGDYLDLIKLKKRKSIICKISYIDISWYCIKKQIAHVLTYNHKLT